MNKSNHMVIMVVGIWLRSKGLGFDLLLCALTELKT